MQWRDVVMPAAELAEQGVDFLEELTPLFAMKAAQLRRDAEARKCYLVGDRTPCAGNVLRFTDLAATLRQLAEDGIEPFYQGEIAKKIVATARAGGSPVTMDDFRSYRAHFNEPLQINFRGHRIITSPPPVAGGVTVLAALKTLEEHDWSAISRDETYIDTVSRVLLQLYPRVDRRIADVRDSRAAARELLSRTFINELRLLASTVEPPVIASPDAVTTVEPTLEDDPQADTSHLVVADSEGNIVCLTQSLSFHFGASVVVPGTGILVNNSMNNFNIINPRSINAPAPGKRPRSALAPVIVEYDGEANLALGIPGGQRIPSTTIQLLLNVIAADEPLSDAFEHWRFHLRRPILQGEPANVIDLEHDAPDILFKRLDSRGWMSVAQVRDGTYFGGGNGVQYLSDGRMIAVADSRRANAVGGK
jgi:gamma-glutamyltranspeptidase/glutathione hydrolase